MGVMDWVREVTGAADRERQAEADRQRQAQIDMQRQASAERAAEKVRLAEQEREARENLGQRRQHDRGPAERAFPEHTAEIKAKIRGDRQREPEKQRQVEPTRHEHQFNPVRQMPTMGMPGVTYVNHRARPARGGRGGDADDLLAEARKRIEEKKRDRPERERTLDDGNERGGRSR